MKTIRSISLRIVCFLVILQTTAACDKLQSIYDSRNDTQLAKAKYWASHEVPQIGAECYLSTSWRAGKMYYIFRANPLVDPKMSLKNKSTDFLIKAIESKNFVHSIDYGYRRPVFTAKLIDKAGFEILSIEMSDAIRMVDDKNKTMGLEEKSSIECSRTKYQDIAGWEIVWRK